MSKSSIEKSAIKEGATVIFCKAVTTLIQNPAKSKKAYRKEKKILLITDCFIEQWDTDEVFEKRAFWFDLLRVSINNEENNFSLEFASPEATESDEERNIDPKNYRFQLTNKGGDLVSFYRIILELIQRILTEQETKNLIFFDDEDLNSDDFEHYNFTPRGAFARFLILSMKKKDQVISQKVKESVAEYLLMKMNNIYIKSEFNIENCLDIFLSSIKPLKHIESVSVPVFNKFIQVDSLNIVANFLKKASEIQHFEIRGPCPKAHFHDLCRSIENLGIFNADSKSGSKKERKSKSKLTAITFDNFEINTKQIASIKTAAITGRLLSLGINNIRPFVNSNSKSDEKDAIKDYIVDSLLTPPLTSYLRILSLDGNRDLDVQKLIENSGSIEKVSLRNCGLEICHVIEALASISSHIDSVDLSYNACSSTDIEKAISSLPFQLLRLDVNNVKWSDDCLTSFLRGIVKLYELPDSEFEEEEEDDDDSEMKRFFLNSVENVNSGLNSTLVTLSMSFAEASKSEWQNARTFFEDNSRRISIEQFSWNGNRLSQQLIVFLKNMKRIKRLFLNGCPNFAQHASSFAANFVAKSATLRELHIEKANSEFPEGSSFSTFLKKLQSSTSLRLLNVRQCSIGDDGIDALSALVEKCQSKALNQIAFDGAAVESFDSIADFVDACQNVVKTANKKKRSSSSKKGCRKMFIELPAHDLRVLKIPEAEIEQLKVDLADLTRNPKEEDDLWIKPHEFYVMQNNDAFPTYLHPKIAKRLRREQEKVAEKQRSLRKSDKKKDSEKRLTNKQKQPEDDGNGNATFGKRRKFLRNSAKSFRNADSKNFLYVGNDEVDQQKDEDEDDLNIRESLRRTRKMEKSVYDEALDEDEDDKLAEVRERAIAAPSRKSLSQFRFNDWRLPVSGIDNIDEVNENVVIKLQDRFSLNQLIAEAKIDDNRF